jgi:hypothetical protein
MIGEQQKQRNEKWYDDKCSEDTKKMNATKQAMVNR